MSPPTLLTTSRFLPPPTSCHVLLRVTPHFFPSPVSCLHHPVLVAAPATSRHLLLLVRKNLLAACLHVRFLTPTAASTGRYSATRPPHSHTCIHTRAPFHCIDVFHLNCFCIALGRQPALLTWRCRAGGGWEVAGSASVCVCVCVCVLLQPQSALTCTHRPTLTTRGCFLGLSPPCVVFFFCGGI